MKTTKEKLKTLEFRTESIGDHKTNNTKSSQNSYQKDLKEIPVLIQELKNEVKGSEVYLKRYNDAVTTFNYWS